MQSTRLIFLRHAETQKDPLVNAAAWVLSDVGTAQAVEACNASIMNDVGAIFVSEEPKTALTVAALAEKLGITPQVSADFNEVKRGDAFLTKEAFEIEKKKQLEDLSYHAFGGESAREALARFKRGVESATAKDAAGSAAILIVTHGTVLNLYFADLLGVEAQLPERWNNTAFCAVGIVENGVVVKDILS